MDATFQIPGIDKLVDEHIRKAIIDVLDKDHEKLIAAVVDQAMNQKANTYDRTTIFQNAVNGMIRESAKQAMGEWLEEKKPVIRAAILKRLKGDEGQFVDRVADQLVDALSTKFYVSISLTD